MNDLIRRNDALDILCESCGISEDVEKCRKTSADGWCKEYCELKNMPSIDAEPVRHGHWIELTDPLLSCVCSACGQEYHLYEDDICGYPYCAKCGAKMDERKEE